MATRKQVNKKTSVVLDSFRVEDEEVGSIVEDDGKYYIVVITKGKKSFMEFVPELQEEPYKEPSNKLSKEPSKELSKEPSKELSKEPSKKLSKEPSKELSKELSKEPSKSEITTFTEDDSGNGSIFPIKPHNIDYDSEAMDDFKEELKEELKKEIMAEIKDDLMEEINDLKADLKELKIEFKNEMEKFEAIRKSNVMDDIKTDKASSSITTETAIKNAEVPLKKKPVKKQPSVATDSDNKKEKALKTSGSKVVNDTDDANETSSKNTTDKAKAKTCRNSFVSMTIAELKKTRTDLIGRERVAEANRIWSNMPIHEKAEMTKKFKEEHEQEEEQDATSAINTE